MNFDLNLYFLWHNIVCEHGRYHSLWFLEEEFSHASRVTPRTSTAMALGNGVLLKLSISWVLFASRTLSDDSGPLLCCSRLMFLKLRATALGTACREVEEGRC